MHTHFLRDDTRIQTFVRAREAVGKAGWNPALVDKPQTIEDLKWNNYFKEIFLDSDTKIALISSAPSDIPQDWFLTNEMTIAAREQVNKEAGSRRMLAHAIFTPGQPGWLEHLEHALAHEARTRSRATRSATTPTRTSASIPGGWTTRRSPTRPTSWREARHQERLRAQGAVSRVDRAAVPAPARLLRRARRRQGGEGLAAAQLRHLPRRLSPRRRRHRRAAAGTSSSRPGASPG